MSSCRLAMWAAQDTEPPLTREVGRHSEDHRLEPIDQRLVELLVRDGRSSLTQLAQAVGLSVSAVGARVHRLRDLGVITGFHASVDQSMLRQALCATMRVRIGSVERVAGFEEWLTGQPEVTEMFHCMGNFDYELRLACRDAERLNTAISAIRRAAGAVDTETTVLLSRVDARGPAD